MYKLVIADDEPKIRKGLKNILDWTKYDIQYVGEAEDGENAYNVFKQLKPDIMFLDICMPFLSGMDLITKLRNENQYCHIIVITGYDEFTYTQQAIRLGVFDYLLKPVSISDMENAVKRAVADLNKIKHSYNNFNLTDKKPDVISDIIRDQFLFSYICNNTKSENFDEESLLGVKKDSKTTLLIIKLNKSLAINNEDKNSLCYGIRNILEETLENSNFISCFFDNKNSNIVTVYGTNESEQPSRYKTVIDYVTSFTHLNLLYENVPNLNIYQLPEIYLNICNMLTEKSKLRPITQLIVNYIENHFNEKSLSLENTAAYFKMSSSYLSKIMKDETGLSYVDFLTDTRIKKAKYLLENPEIKIYETSELVGYSNQYYFSRAFKKFTGISPIQFKEGRRNCEKNF